MRVHKVGKVPFRNYKVLIGRYAAEVIHSPSPRHTVAVHHCPGCPSLATVSPASLDAMEACGCRPTPVIEIEALREHDVGEINNE